jgi:hypothetical protein
MTDTELPASLTAFGYPSRPARAVVIEQSSGQRVARALVGLGMCWGGALVGLFIPVAHFILVPTFVTAGVILAVKRGREDRRLIAVRGACPRCGNEQEFKPGGRFVAGRKFDCPRCHGNLGLDPATSNEST